jgi:hypothetical protein
VSEKEASTEADAGGAEAVKFGGPVLVSQQPHKFCPITAKAIDQLPRVLAANPELLGEDAHEFYAEHRGRARGLTSNEAPDYWDFLVVAALFE